MKKIVLLSVMAMFAFGATAQAGLCWRDLNPLTWFCCDEEPEPCCYEVKEVKCNVCEDDHMHGNPHIMKNHK